MNADDPLRQAIRDAYLADESACMQRCLGRITLDPQGQKRVFEKAYATVKQLRAEPGACKGLDALLQEYDLSSEEGVVLLCLAESLLRIPDAETADKLIRDKLLEGHWEKHLGKSESILVNASTWGLMLTGQLVRLTADTRSNLATTLRNLALRSGEPLLRVAFRQAMDIVGRQFVLGETIEQAMDRSDAKSAPRYLYSYDMLGEAAMTATDAKRYLDAYMHAVDVIGRHARHEGRRNPGISVKLSALHPRYEHAQRERILGELPERLMELVCRAREFDLLVTVDAEESDRLDLSLDVFDAVYSDPGLAGWDGLGMAVQAYQKRALPVLDWLADLAARQRRVIPVRLVKGAYWDQEVKTAQVQGLRGYPVFTRKSHTDVSYLACVCRLFEAAPWVYPQFATHNAHTISAVQVLGEGRDFEFQRLHGMGQGLYDLLLEQAEDLRCRVYAPVGGHAELLSYLVRRLLENGANTSFVNRILHREVAVEDVVADPVEHSRENRYLPNPRIPLPAHLYRGQRLNSDGLNLADDADVATLQRALSEAGQRQWIAAPLVEGKNLQPPEYPVYDPARRLRRTGRVAWTSAAQVGEAVAAAARGFPVWQATAPGHRADLLERAAELLQSARAALMYLCIREGGRTVRDAAAEVREAVDYCRYYAWLAREQMASPSPLTGPSGESNELRLHPRGVFACISPWNFPLAIYLGQITAALAAGNSVVAKPAQQTPLIAHYAASLLHQAGVPAHALHVLPGDGDTGARLVAHPDIAGVVFTGSTETAKRIQRSLAEKAGPIVPLVAETGGQNAMIVDSSALSEQVVADVLESAFNSAGQRCSALRALFLQEDVAPRILQMLTGAMEELCLGDPMQLSTDVGPVIDGGAVEKLHRHAEFLRRNGRLIHRCRLPEGTREGTYFPPHCFEIPSLDLLKGEVFGPILHVVRFAANELAAVVDAINATGYGLTLGVHSRIDETVDYVIGHARAGNIYINRNMIGAVVGVQPFGGEGLSGTGPKAGGPDYLKRLCTERTVCNNIAAVGGDPTLLSLTE